jgi:5-methylcytosine-specific restriction endonuclease McrA
MTDEERKERKRKIHQEMLARKRARKRGDHVPAVPSGPKKGYKQRESHTRNNVAANSGENRCNWLGDNATQRAGRARALRKYKTIGPCEDCGSEKSERHHRDGNALNNSPENMEALCKKCHMKRHWTPEKREFMRKVVQPLGSAASAKKRRNGTST